ncbi:hypothetical protein PRIPAC_84790, partial [Pristionchus pacificus]
WMCETDFEFIFGPSEFKRQNIFTHNKKAYVVYCIAEESLRTSTGYINMDKIVVEFRVKVLSSEPPIFDLSKFSSPNELSNVTLVIGDEKLRVCKDYLSIHSPFFAAMFFGDFAEKEKEEVELKEIIYEEFIDLLQLIYFKNMEITDRIVSHILKLGDRFQIQCAVDLSEKHLKSSSNLTVAKKLMLADQYRLTSLKDHCLQSFTSVADLIGKLKSSPECTNYSDAMAASIFREMMKFNAQMTDNSSFDLRWEIDNATAKFTAWSGESEVFNERGFEWKVGFDSNKNNRHVLDFTLACDHPGKGEWKCEAEIVFLICSLVSQGSLTSSKSKQTFCIGDPLYRYIRMDKALVIARVRIISSELPTAPAIDLTQLSSPNEMNNVILLIGDKKLRVCKDYLAVHSPVFASMFFNDFAEKGKEEVDLNEIVYEEFLDLLQLIYLGDVDITDRSVPHLLKLGDRFQMQRVLDLSEKHLKISSNLNVAKKLMLADKYRLASLKDHCLQSFTSVADLKEKLKLSPEFADYSDSMTAEICRLMMKLNPYHAIDLGERMQGSIFDRVKQTMAAIPKQFEAPTAFSNVVLIVDGKKLHVNKDYLSVHSPVFAAMFNGDFVEKGKEEIEIKEVVYEEFVDLLTVIYPGCPTFTASSVEYIHKLADQFQMKDAREQVEQFLIETATITVEKKLILAEKINNEKIVVNFRMSDSNTFVLRWVLRNATEITNRTAESDVLEACGFEWTAQMRPQSTVSDKVDFLLMCVHPGEWSCEVEVEFVIVGKIKASISKKCSLILDNSNTAQLCDIRIWTALKDSNLGSIIDNTISIEYHIKIVNSKCDDIAEPILDLEKFCSPNEACNVKLIIGGEKLEVSKDFLAIHSPVFATMFYKNFAEKDKDEIEVKEVDYKEFTDLLQLIFPVQAKITNRKILHVLALADRFQMKQILFAAEEYLMTSSNFCTAEKLRLADGYRLIKLFLYFKSTPEYASFTDAMKAAICDRIMNLA